MLLDGRQKGGSSTFKMRELEVTPNPSPRDDHPATPQIRKTEGLQHYQCLKEIPSSIERPK